MLVFLGAYGYHKKLVESSRLNVYSVFPIIVLDQSIGVVQPHDVGINHNF